MPSGDLFRRALEVSIVFLFVFSSHTIIIAFVLGRDEEPLLGERSIGRGGTIYDFAPWVRIWNVAPGRPVDSAVTVEMMPMPARAPRMRPAGK